MDSEAFFCLGRFEGVVALWFVVCLCLFCKFAGVVVDWCRFLRWRCVMFFE